MQWGDENLDVWKGVICGSGWHQLRVKSWNHISTWLLVARQMKKPLEWIYKCEGV